MRPKVQQPGLITVRTISDVNPSLSRRKNVVSRQSRVLWDCPHIADDRGLGTTSNATRFGSQLPRRGPSGQESERCQEDAANSAGQGTLPRGGQWRLRSPNPGEHSRLSEG